MTDFTLRPWREADAASIARYADNAKIAANLRDVFPCPYAPQDAATFVESCIRQEGRGQMCRAIEVYGEAAGSIGLFLGSDVYRRSAELGYWLGEPFWGRGIMTAAVETMCREGFAAWDIVRICQECGLPPGTGEGGVRPGGHSAAERVQKRGDAGFLHLRPGEGGSAMTKRLMVGDVAVGGGAPVSIQSMCNTKTDDVRATVEQIHALEAAGCEIIRIAIPDQAAAESVDRIKEQISIPLIADIHFNYKYALACAERGIDAIRINPGNIGGEEKVKAVADICRQKSIPIRIGVNGGSLEKDLRAKYGGVTAEALVESAMGHVALLNKFDFDDICISVKCSDVPLTMAAYRLLSERTDYPLHLGVTEAGTPSMGLVKSAMGIGGLLCLGIGDTIRVTLTADPIEEIFAAKKILKAAGLRKEGVNLIACPTCGRTRIDLIPMAEEVERRLMNCTKNITVAVMGCAVNGPGEAAAADIGIAGGKGEGLIFRKGEILYKVPQEQLVDKLMEEIEKLP